MRYFRILVCSVFALTFLSHLTDVAQAQTPAAAVRHYSEGEKRIAEGDFPAAIEVFTRAIELSSHPFGAGTARQKDQPVVLGFAASEPEADTVTIIDPFTARAYTNRCFLFYHQQEFDRAIDDCNRALKISPGLAAA